MIQLRYIFEYDELKSESNKLKHGIDFFQSQKLWYDADLLEIPARVLDEERFLVVGEIEGTHWSAVITYRDEAIRIISVRRSRNSEINIYEKEKNKQQRVR